MYAISLDVIRGILTIRIRGRLSDAERTELVDSVRQALAETPAPTGDSWHVRVSAKPVAEYTPAIAAEVESIVSQCSQRPPSAPPASQVVQFRALTEGGAARLVDFITA